MFRHNNFRKIISFCLVTCMSMMCAIHVSANSSSNLTSNNIGVDVFLNTADKIENESNGIRYTFNNLHSTVFMITTLIISKKPGNTGISRDIRTEFTTDLLLSD